MNNPSYLGLVHNFALLLALIIIFDVVVQRELRKKIHFYFIYSGFLIGGIGILVMLTPWVLNPGVIFDTRSILLSISGLFFGIIPTLIAMGITVVFRIYQGGGGALTGVLVILSTGTIGIIWHYFRKNKLEKIKWWELYLFGLINHIVMLLLMLTLPDSVVRHVLETISLPVLIIYPIGTLLLGFVLRNRLQREKTKEDFILTTKLLNTTQSLSKVGGWEWNVKNQSMFWTDELYRIHGYSSEEIPPGTTDHIDKSILCYDPEDRSIILDAFKKCADFGISYDLEFPFTTVQGEHKWVRTRAEAVKKNGKIIRVVGNMMDITERKQSELELAASETNFKSLIESAPVGFLISDNEQNTLFVNQKFTELTGYDIVNIPSINEWWLKAYQDENYRNSIQEKTSTAIEKSMLTKTEIFPIECNVDCKDGSGKYLEIGYMPLGKFNIVTFVDLTKRKIAEDEVRAKEAFTRALMDNLPIGIAVNTVSPTVQFEYVNDNFLEFYQITREQLTNPDEFWDVVYEDPEFRKQIKKRVLDDIASGDPKKWVWENIPVTRKGKETRYISAYNTPVPERNVHISTVIDVTESNLYAEKIKADQKELQQLLAEAERSRQTLLSLIEDQKEAEEHIRRLNQELESRVQERTAQLEASNKELEAFAYSVSHDLRAPLRGIEGFSRILEQDYGQSLDQEGRRLIDIIRQSTKQMDRLIIDILALSRVSRSPIKFSAFDMTSLVRTIVNEIAPQDIFEKFNISVSELPKSHADPTLMRQVWLNLISNAIKYTKPRDVCIIKISGYEDQESCNYKIEDNGVGFDTQYSEKLFNLFQRLHNEREFEGTGVGLAIVKRIIQRHNGKVWAESEMGKGATFNFSIPKRQVSSG